MTRSRLLIPFAAALAVMVLTGGIWWLTARSDDGGSEAQPGASAPADDNPPCCKTEEPSGGGSTGSVGTGSGSSGGMTDPGSGTPVEPPPNEDPAPGSIRVDSFYQRNATTLALNYTIGVPECYGTVTGVKVDETASTVTVTLVHEPAKTAGDVACIDLAVLKSIDVHLDSPLGDRVVKDGAFEDKVVEEADATYDEGGY